MKLVFDRTAYFNETGVLTNFEKPHEVSEELTVRELTRRFINQHLKLKAHPGRDSFWRIIAISDMSMREVAVVENEAPIYINTPDETLADFLGQSESVTILAIYLHQEEVSLLNAMKKESQPWKKLELPIRVDTRGREVLAFMMGIMAITSVLLVIIQYNSNKVIATEGILGLILFPLALYLLLLQSRNIVFNTRSIMYRNKYTKYEKINADQFDFLDWGGHGRNFKFVFKFDEKGRNYISATTESFLDIIVWSVSNRIPIYSSDISGRI